MLLVLHEELLGGASRGALRALGPLVDRGLDLRVWCARPSALFDELSAAGMQVAGAPRPLRYSWSTLRTSPGPVRRLGGVPGSLRAFARHLRAVEPDLVHANAMLSLPEAFVARRAGVPVFFHYHDAELPGLKGAVVRRAAWRAGHAVAALSDAHARQLEHRGRRPLIHPPPVAVPGAPVSFVRPREDPLAVVTVGVLGPRKGTDVFIEAAERLAGHEPRLAFRIVGGPEDAPSPQWVEEHLARARAAGVGHSARVDVAAELPGWDIVVAPSRREPFGLVVAEGMAAARAVIGARVDGIAETLAGGGGVLVPPGDAAALADAIADLAARPERRAELGAEGHRIAHRFDVPHAAERLAAAYAQTLTAAGAAAPWRTGRGRGRRPATG